jgi:hypothetical protein
MKNPWHWNERTRAASSTVIFFWTDYVAQYTRRLEYAVKGYASIVGPGKNDKPRGLGRPCDKL